MVVVVGLLLEEEDEVYLSNLHYHFVVSYLITILHEGFGGRDGGRGGRGGRGDDGPPEEICGE